MIDGWGVCCEITLIWMSLDFIDDQSTLVQVMAWCRQATSHYLSQCWPTSPSPYGVTRPQWVNYAGVLQQVPIFHEEGFQTPESSRCWEMTENLNPSDAGDRIFWLWQSIPCLLISWLLQSPEHQQAWYCLCKTDSMYFCSRVNFISLGRAKSKIQFKMWIWIL